MFMNVSTIRKDLLKIFCLLSVFLLLEGCEGANNNNFQTMLQHLSNSYPDLWRLLTAFSYVMGFALALKALYNLKIYGEMRTMTSSQASMKTPLTYMLASTMLIFAPTAFSIVNYTFFGDDNPLSYTSGGVGGFTQSSIIAVIGVVQIIGLVAFVRGWLLVARAGEQGGQPGTVGKAMTHIIGGAFAINVVQVKDVIWNTFGFGS